MVVAWAGVRRFARGESLRCRSGIAKGAAIACFVVPLVTLAACGAGESAGDTGSGSMTGMGSTTEATGDSGGDTVIPLGECVGDPSAQGGSTPLECEVEAMPWCDAPCPVDAQVTITCARPVFPVIRSAPDGHAWVVADPATDGMAPTLVELVAEPAFTMLPGIPVGAAFAIDAANAPQLLHGSDWNDPWLWHRTPEGTDEVIACLSGQTLWTVHDLAEGPQGLVGLVGWLQETASGFALARREAGGSWTIEDLHIATPFSPGFALADDGTPLLAFVEETADGFVARVGVGDTWHDIPLAAEPMSGEPRVVPGPTGPHAVVSLGTMGLEIATLDSDAVLVGGTAPLVVTSCDPSQLTECSGTCRQTGQGPAWSPFVARDGDDVVIAYVEATVDVDVHYEGEVCGPEGPGCSCDAIVDEDRSQGELVLVRAALAPFAATEVLRLSLPFLGTAPRLFGSQAADGTVALALQGTDDAVRVGTIDLSTLR